MGGVYVRMHQVGVGLRGTHSTDSGSNREVTCWTESILLSSRILNQLASPHLGHVISCVYLSRLP